MNHTAHTLTDLFEGLGRSSKPAIVQADSAAPRTLTYDKLARLVGDHASGLTAAGLEAGDRVLVFAPGGPAWISAFLAVIAAGGVPIPCDVQTDEETLRHVVDHSGATWAVTDDALAEVLAGLRFAGTVLPLDPDRDEQAWIGEGQPRPTIRFEPDATAVLFYTSGTTGMPKGVPLSQRNLAFQIRAVNEAGLVGEDDTILQPLPPHHVYPLIVGTLAPLALGLTVVIPEAMLGPQLVAALQAHDVTFIVGVPRLYDALVAAIESRIENQPGIGGAYLRFAYRTSRRIRQRFGLRLGKLLLFPLHRRMAPRLDVLASGGAALNPLIALKIESLGWKVASGYGLTETSPLLTINPPGSGRLDSVGRIVPGIELKIDGRVTGTDELEQDGEILARGDGVFAGYLNLERDADSFTDDGWFRTKDLGRIDDDGYVRITGRRNTMLVTSAGKNIQPDELEGRYAEHELIDEIGILMDEQQLAAVVVPNLARVSELNLSPENAVRLALSQRGRELRSYQRVGRHVLARDALPRTRLGKIQRHKLADRYAALRADPEHQASLGAALPIAEMTADDRQRLESPRARSVWDLLAERYPKHGLQPATSLQVDLGIDSLGWLELSTELSRQLGIGLSEAEIAGVETVRDLLDLAASSTAGSHGQASPVEDPAAYLSAEQQRWLEPLPPASRRRADRLYGLHNTMMRALFRIRVEGVEHLPRDRQWILAPNHVSFLDPSAVAAALPKDVLATTHWAGWTGYAFRNALFRRLSRLAQIVPVDPENAASSSLAFAAAVLARGRNLVLFPEGERSASAELLPIKPGIGLLTTHFDEVLIVPAWISGTLEAWPRDRRLPRPRPVTVRFGRPLDPAAIKAKAGENPPAVAITATLRGALETLRDESGSAPSAR